ncbi:hypothetical protein E2320_007741 [Naja naja]|nr:hypothetical protein E2320_007741 [Naja naja]
MLVFKRRAVWGDERVGVPFVRGPGFCDRSARVETRRKETNLASRIRRQLESKGSGEPRRISDACPVPGECQK